KEHPAVDYLAAAYQRTSLNHIHLKVHSLDLEAGYCFHYLKSTTQSNNSFSCILYLLGYVCRRYLLFTHTMHVSEGPSVFWYHTKASGSKQVHCLVKFHLLLFLSGTFQVFPPLQKHHLV